MSTSTITSFRVTVFGNSFDMQARSPFGIQQEHYGGQDLHCWVRMKTAPETFFWTEIPLLQRSDAFDTVHHLLGNTFVVTFRGKSAESPNTSLDDGLVLDKYTTPKTSSVVTETSTLASLSLPSSFAEGDDASLCPEAPIVNDIEPFTLEDFEDVDDLIHMCFPVPGSSKFETVCVSCKSFELFVEGQFEKGEDIRTASLKSITCKNGEIRDFKLPPFVWARSIVKHSRSPRSQRLHWSARNN